MSKPFFLSFSTYQKTDAAQALLDSLIQHGYADSAQIHLADDNAGRPYTIYRDKNTSHPCWNNLPKDVTEHSMRSAVDLYEEYKAKIPDLALSYGKERLGIAGNKNRSIYYFLEKTKAEHCLLLDDDIVFRAPGMLEEWRQVLQDNTFVRNGYRSQLSHLTGFWTDFNPDYIDPLKNQPWAVSREGWFKDFPVEALADQRGKVEWRKGTMGVSNFYTRRALQAVGYYDTNLSKYGFEHTLHSARVLQLVDKRAPNLYPLYYNCARYFIGQNIANNYFDAAEEAAKADPIFGRRMREIGLGINLSVKNSGLKQSKETILS